MKMIPNAAKVAKKASSMWLIYGSIGLQVAAELAPHIAEAVPGGRWLLIGVTAAAGAARLVKQEALSDDR